MPQGVDLPYLNLLFQSDEELLAPLLMNIENHSWDEEHLRQDLREKLHQESPT